MKNISCIRGYPLNYACRTVPWTPEGAPLQTPAATPHCRTSGLDGYGVSAERNVLGRASVTRQAYDKHNKCTTGKWSSQVFWQHGRAQRLAYRQTRPRLQST